MTDSPPVRKHKQVESIGSFGEHPLWLLQKEDTPSLVVSFLLSAVAHAALFALLTATRVFHPFAGASTPFDLLWLSLGPASETQERQTVVEPAPAAAENTAHKIPEKASTSPEPDETAGRIPGKPVPAAEQTAGIPPAVEETPSAATEVTETETEIMISRYRGKVVDIIEKKEEIPTFKVFSSVFLQSRGAKAKVRTVSENLSDSHPRPVALRTREQGKAKEEEGTDGGKPPAAVTASAGPIRPVQGDLSSAVTSAPAVKGAPAVDNMAANGLHASATPSGATAPTAGKPAVREAGNGGNATPDTPSAAPSAGESAGGEAGKGATASASPPAGAGPRTAARLEAPSAPKGDAPEAKPSPPAPAKPTPLLHPPVIGDLKLVITAAGEIGVETAFTEFRKARRDKPMSRREWLRKRKVVPKVVRTKEDVIEAVLETTEEGIYELMVQSAHGAPVRAAFVLRIHESAPGAKTRNLGARVVAEKATIAKVLMPEGLLWDDDASFTGDMEDSESVTKFQAETGLVWKEYK